jgi:hypothetical protein
LPPSVVFISFLSSLKLIDNYYSLLYAALAGLVFGAIIGFAQFFIIRKFYRKALLWIIANAVGWILSFTIVYVALLLFSYSTLVVYNIIIIILSCSLSGLLQGLVTGTVLNLYMPLRNKEWPNIGIALWHSIRAPGTFLYYRGFSTLTFVFM